MKRTEKSVKYDDKKFINENIENKKIMTRENTAECNKVMQAYVEGKPIQYADAETEDWIDIESPDWNWDNYDYRVKPAPKYRPFANAVECLKEMQKHTPFGLIKKNVNGTFYCIGSFDIKNIYIGAKQSIRSYADSLEKFTFVDDTPFGVKVEE